MRSPFSNNEVIPFRSGADSSQYNELNDQVFYDLTELYNAINEEDEQLIKLRQFFEIGSHFSQEQIDQLTKEVEDLRENILAIQQPGKEYVKTIPVTSMRLDEAADESERCVIDTQHDVVHLPTWGYSNSKLYLYDDLNDEYIVPNTLSYKVLPEADLSIKENDLLDAITPNQSKFWHRNYTYLSGTRSYVDTVVTIDLPDEIISSRDVNTIFLHPFPLNTMDIRNIEYQVNGGWNTIPGFQPKEEVGNVKYCFSPTEMSAIRFTIRQRHFIRNGNKDVFHVGIRQIGVEFSDYQSEIGKFTIPVDFSTYFTKKEILDVRPIYANRESLSVHQEGVRLATFKIYEVEDSGKGTYLNDTFPIQVKEKRVLIKAIMSMDKSTRSTPALTGVEVVYKGDS